MSPSVRGFIHVLAGFGLQSLNIEFIPMPYKLYVGGTLAALSALIAYLDVTLSK